MVCHLPVCHLPACHGLNPDLVLAGTSIKSGFNVGTAHSPNLTLMLVLRSYQIQI